MKCPLDSFRQDGGSFYSSFLENVEEFRSIGALPTTIFLGSDFTADDLLAHRASWHKSCCLKYSISMLTRAKKRKADCAEPERVPRKRQAMNVTNCMFCDKGSEVGDLHQIVTFDADANIREMIVALQDTQLLAKIDGGDLIAKEVKYHLKCLVTLKNRYRSYKDTNSRAKQCTGIHE